MCPFPIGVGVVPWEEGRIRPRYYRAEIGSRGTDVWPYEGGCSAICAWARGCIICVGRNQFSSNSSRETEAQRLQYQSDRIRLLGILQGQIAELQSAQRRIQKAQLDALPEHRHILDRIMPDIEKIADSIRPILEEFTDPAPFEMGSHVDRMLLQRHLHWSQVVSSTVTEIAAHSSELLAMAQRHRQQQGEAK